MTVRATLLLSLLAACGGTDPVAEASWQLVRENETASILAVWGTSASDVWTVGGRAEPTGGPTIHRYDGTTWTQRDSLQSSLDLWWVFGFEGGDVFLSGSGGTILRYRNDTFEKMTTPRNAGTIFGMWGAAPDDLWAVGSASSAIVWRYDGNTWTEVALPAGVPSSVFKVAGRTENDVWMSCAGGVTLHWNGSSLERVATPITAPLFSVVTTPELSVAVGGMGAESQLLENDGSGWIALTAPSVPAAWRGAAALGDEVYVVGESGLVAKRTTAGWTRQNHTLTQQNFHSAWVDPDGGFWGVGGKFAQMPYVDGFLLYYGTQDINEVSPRARSSTAGSVPRYARSSAGSSMR